MNISPHQPPPPAKPLPEPQAGPSFQTALSPNDASAGPELAQRLDADMGRIFADYPMRETPHNAEICQLLNQCLADCIDLQCQSRQARWHVRDPGATGLHGLFDAITEITARAIARLAERITGLGGIAEGTIAAVAQRTGLNEYPLYVQRDAQHVDTVASALAVISVSLAHDRQLLAEFGDSVSLAVLTEILRSVEGYLRALEARQQNAEHA